MNIQCRSVDVELLCIHIHYYVLSIKQIEVLRYIHTYQDMNQLCIFVCLYLFPYTFSHQLKVLDYYTSLTSYWYHCRTLLYNNHNLPSHSIHHQLQNKKTLIITCNVFKIVFHERVNHILIFHFAMHVLKFTNSNLDMVYCYICVRLYAFPDKPSHQQQVQDCYMSLTSYWYHCRTLLYKIHNLPSHSIHRQLQNKQNHTIIIIYSILQNTILESLINLTCSMINEF